MTTIINATIYDYHQFKEDQYITFDKTIKAIGNMSNYKGINDVIIDAKGALVMPGMINGHSHIYSTFARGMNVPFNPNNFKELLEQLWWKLDQHLTNDMTYYSAIVASVEHLKNGVTTVIDHHASGEISGSLEALRKAVVDVCHLRGAFCFETSDRYDVQSCIKENHDFITSHHSDMEQGLFGLHASFTLSEKTLAEVHQSQNAPIHIHVTESSYDVKHAQETYHMSPIERLQKHQLLVPGSLLAHAIHTTEGDLQIIKDQGAAIVVNVTSNMNNGVGIPDVLAYHKHNIPVVIGNDGISYSMAQEYISLYFAMHHLYQSPTMFTMDTLLQLIQDTYTYTSELFGIQMGKIAKDYVADLVIIPYTPPTPMNQDNILGHLIFGAYRNYRPSNVFIGGTHILKNNTLDNKLLHEYQTAKSRAQDCWDDIAKGV